MGRTKTYTTRCTEPGCREYGIHEYERASEPRVKNWLCYRHRNPEQLLSDDNRKRVTVLTVEARDDISGKHFFNGKNGTVSGPGFKAIAEDFPVGTKLVITAELVAASRGEHAASEPIRIGPVCP